MILTLYHYALIPCFWLMYYLFISVSGLFFLKWLKCNIALFREKKGIDDCSSSIKNQEEENGINNTSEHEGNIVEKEASICVR